MIQVAVNDARWICKRKYGFAPEVEMVGGESLVLPMIPEHLYYMTLELIKNSLRAQSERFHDQYIKNDVCNMPPAIQINLSHDYSLSEGPQVVIEVNDHGGGIPEENFERIFCYLFTTAEPEVQASMIAGEQNPCKKVPLAGLGYGLPLCKMYAHYHGGDLVIQNRPGKGCSARVSLSRLADRKEPLV